MGLLLPSVDGLGTTSTAKDEKKIFLRFGILNVQCCVVINVSLTIVAVFTMLHVDRSSLGDGTVLLSKVQKEKKK